VATLSSGSDALDIKGLEDFALSGADAEIDYLLHRPSFNVLRDRIWQEGHQAGVQEAEQRALEARREMAAGPLAQFEALLYQLKQQRSEFLRANGNEVLALVFAISRKVVRAQLRVNEAMMAERLQACLESLGKQSSYRIKVNPGQITGLRALLEETGGSLPSDTPFNLDGDPSIPEGGLILEGETSRVEMICDDELTRIELMLSEMVDGEDGDA
jgi:flagellar biosynthesis/type III secretory pathway protein FliH